MKSRFPGHRAAPMRHPPAAGDLLAGHWSPITERFDPTMRGWLMPRLMPLGTVPAILISGVIWGAWHAPLILLGYNYPGVPGWLGVAAMITMYTLVGALFGWLRLRSASVWPAALAHAAFNGAAGSHLLFATAGAPVDTTRATVLGWSGWIVPLVLVVALVATGRFAPAAERCPSGR